MSKTNWDETLYKFSYVRFGKSVDDDDDDTSYFATADESANDDDDDDDDEYVVDTSFSATADEPVNESITNDKRIIYKSVLLWFIIKEVILNDV